MNRLEILNHLDKITRKDKLKAIYSFMENKTFHLVPRIHLFYGEDGVLIFSTLNKFVPQHLRKKGSPSSFINYRLTNSVKTDVLDFLYSKLFIQKE